MKDREYKVLAYATLITGWVSILFCVIGLVQLISSFIKGELYIMPAVLVIAVVSMGISRTLLAAKTSRKHKLTEN